MSVLRLRQRKNRGMCVLNPDDAIKTFNKNKNGTIAAKVKGVGRPQIFLCYETQKLTRLCE